MSANISSKLIEKLKVYTAYANDCIKFKYIFDEEDLNEESSSKMPLNKSFNPEYTHQIFGDDETIIGYKNLKIKYFLTPAALNAYIGLVYSEKISPKRFDGIEADDIYDAFVKFGCSPGFTRNLDTFSVEKLKQDFEFRPFGVKIHEYSKGAAGGYVLKNSSANELASKYEIYKVDSSCSKFHGQKFVDYLMRVQTMLVYYIETASFVDTDDDQWTFYFLYEKRKCTDSTYSNSNSSSSSNERYVTVGYMSVYNYYAYPDKTRTRISQMLIMPPYQKSGHGARLMESVYLDAAKNAKILEITAESPSIEFVKLRDYVTSYMCMKLDSFQSGDALKKPFNQDMISEALKKYKMPKLQSRRCYEILRLKYTNENNQDEWTQYRLDIKKRLYQPFIRNNKFARNAGNITDTRTQQNEQPKEEQPNGKSNAKDKCAARFGNGTSASSSDGVTTIGFGPAPSSSAKSVSFAKPSSLSSRLGGESSSSPAFPVGSSSSSSSSKVRFMDEPKSKLSTSYSSADDEEDEDESENDESNTNAAQYANLFMNEAERKQYLEKQFQEIVQDYKSTLKRLEHV